ncbi:MAG: hypothetical protein AAGE92_09260, partial [Cyanobacteria bacterium P01_G01_bin.4]
ERWVYETVTALEKGDSEVKPLPEDSEDSESISEKLRGDLLKQGSILDTANQKKFEIILAASGKAIVLTRTEEQAKHLIQVVTTRALKDAPGLDMCGAYLTFAPEDFDNAEEFSNRFNQLLDDIHRKHAYIHAKRPGNATRFLRLPIIENCKTSNLPAAGLQEQPSPAGQPASDPLPCSAVSKAKIKARDQASERLNKLLKTGATGGEHWTFPKNSHQLEQALKQSADNNWLAVVHADGNGLGQIFLNFATHLDVTHLDTGERKLAAAFAKLRQFSIELDRCTENAFREALHNTFPTPPPRSRIPRHFNRQAPASSSGPSDFGRRRSHRPLRWPQSP